MHTNILPCEEGKKGTGAADAPTSSAGLSPEKNMHNGVLKYIKGSMLNGKIIC